MKQKTVYTTIRHSVGDTVLLVSREYLGKDHYYIYSGLLAETGYPGIVNPAVCRYHGWRGCYDGADVYAYGLHKVKSVTSTGKVSAYGNPVYKVVVGPDLHPDWD